MSGFLYNKYVPAYDVFFYGALFFLGGIAGASLGLHTSLLCIAALSIAVFLLLWCLKKEKKFLWHAGLSLLFLAGALYYTGFTVGDTARGVISGKIVFEGIVDENPQIKNTFQSLVIKVRSGASRDARILVTTDRYPSFHYGDVLHMSGTIGKPDSDSFDRYLKKERIDGSIRFPKISLLLEHQGSSFRSFLFSVRARVLESFGKLLPQREAAFLGGLTLGDRSGFSKEFVSAMQESGTTHLVALSGYNISIVVLAAMSLLVFFVKRNFALLFTGFLIVGFVVMTGIEASVVRAAIMGILMLIAKERGRLFDVRNVIVCAGLVMVLLNPRILVFDAGFGLSFLALLGIVYLKPAIQKRWHMFGKPGFLSWRENLLTTSAAQCMVLPLLLGSFGSFSPLSILSNILVLECVPLTMALGFATGAIAFVSHYAALALSWFVLPLLYFETGVIAFFGKLGFLLEVPFHWSFAIVYYGVIGWFVWKINRKEKEKVLQTV